MRSVLVALVVLAASGCCAGPNYAVLAYNPRAELQARDGFAVLATTLDDEQAWGFGAPSAPLLAHTQAYRPRPAAARDALRPAEEAPAEIAASLAAARAALEALGYRMAGEEDPIGFVLSVALTWRDGGSLSRVAIHVGADVDGPFEPRQVSLAASLPEGGCAVSAGELVRELVSLLPPRGEPLE